MGLRHARGKRYLFGESFQGKELSFPRQSRIQSLITQLQIQSWQSLAKIGASCSFTDSVDRPLHKISPRLNRGDGVSDCEAQIVVAMNSDRQILSGGKMRKRSLHRL